MTTIDQDRNFYHSYRDTLLSDMVKELYENAVRYATPGGCYDNSSHLHALMSMRVMLSHTCKSLKIFAGEFFFDFYKDLRDDFEKASQRIFNSTGEKTKLIIVSKINNKSDTERIKAEIQERAINYFNEFAEVQVACTQKDLQHFYLADYKMLREEAPHAQITRTSPATSIKAKIYFNSPALVDIKDEIFVAMWNKLAKVRGSN